VPYAALAGPDADAALPSYRFRSAGDRAVANDLTAGLLALTPTWGAPTPFSDSAPRPRPQLRLTPDDGVASSVAERASGKPTDDLNPLI
jgi:hypothetical protein